MAKVCIIGFGCVGSGTYDILKKNQNIIAMRTGETVDVKYVVDIRDLTGNEVAPLVTTNFDTVLSDEEVSVVVETMGGTTYAYEYTKAALEHGKNVVTSNKELVALKGDELFELAKKNGVNYFYEAAVGGGIPIIRPMVTSLCANNITEITGILNGTTNYILTNMLKKGVSFKKALATAQELGYAEADPTADIEGYDTGKKISILSSMALGQKVDFNDVHTEGITNVSSEDTQYAEALDAVIKLVGKFSVTEKGAQVFVAPMIIKKDNPLYGVDDVFNAIVVNSDMVGETMFYGKGAGMHATASAVVSDIMEIIKEAPDHKIAPWTSSKGNNVVPYSDVVASFMIRVSSNGDNFKKALAVFDKEKIFEITDDEFALVTVPMTVELEEKIHGIDVISKYMFA